MRSYKNKIIFWFSFGLLLTMFSCGKHENMKKPADYIDPFIGTKGEGNVIPGALRPHSMVKLSPDNLNSPLSGYDYDDNYIVGFSHTHLQGTGGGAYGNILLYPMASDLKKITTGKCFSEFSHAKESATPGYYSVTLLDYNIKAELTSTDHAGFHRYTFPESEKSYILIDVGHSLDKPCEGGNIEIIGDDQIQGYGLYGYPVYFVAKFDKPFQSYGTWNGSKLVRPFVPVPESALIVGDGTGRHGLKGEYFDNKTFSGSPVYTRIDKTVNFRWGMRHPKKLPLNDFSIRWTGKLVPPVTGTYKLRLEGDDGIRFYLDNKLLIDQWVDRGETADIVTVSLHANKPVNIRIEYYENVGVSLARLKWDLVPEIGEIHNNSNKESGTDIGAFVQYSTEKDEKIQVKVGISYISVEQAKRNLDSEIPDWNFNSIQKESETIWNNLLSRVKVESGTEEQKVKFYTSLYHTLITPIDYTEDDSYYTGVTGTGEIYPANGRRFYSDDWCTWDTYRTTHPLQTIVEPERQADYAQSYVSMYDHSGCLPNCQGRWLGCSMGMDGHHTISVLVDIFMKGFTDFDYETAYKAMRENSLNNPGGNEELSQDYLNLGYIAFEYDGGAREKKSSSFTLERAYNDWCLAQMAKALGKDEDYKLFMKRAMNYQNIFDTETGFMRPRYKDGSWKEPFDPGSKQGNSNGFTESNSWQMTWSVSQDIQGLINLMGGRENFVNKLDKYFLENRHNPGNEPDFINPFLFNYAGAPWKTQEVVREIMAKAYGNGPDGLKGNDDSGSLSAWYVFGAMGLYPVCPGSNNYVITSPIFSNIIIDNGNKEGTTFQIKAENSSKENRYIQSAKLNGVSWEKPWILHSDIVKGGVLILEMGSTPNKEWGSELENAPPSISEP